MKHLCSPLVAAGLLLGAFVGWAVATASASVPGGFRGLVENRETDQRAATALLVALIVTPALSLMLLAVGPWNAKLGSTEKGLYASRTV